VHTLADNATVSEVLNQIAYAQPQRTIKIDPADPTTAHALKDWGLSPPDERVVIHTAGKTYELLIGRKITINDSVWARTSGHRSEPVRIIPSTVKTAIEKDLNDFRSRSVFDFETANVTKVAVQLAGNGTMPPQIDEIDFKDNKWSVQKPVVTRADEGGVQSYLNQILALRVTDFVTDTPSNLSPYGLTSPTATVSLSIKPDEEQVLQIGGPVPNKPDQVYAQRVNSNSVFTLARTGVDDLVHGVANVRDRHILPFDSNQATAVSYTVGPSKGEVRKTGGVWNAVGANAGPADPGKVTDLLSRLSQLRTTPLMKDSVTDLKPFGLDHPSGKITVESGDLKAPLILSIGKSENKLTYVRTSLEPFVYTVPDGTFSFLPADNLALRDARAINLDLTKVRTMSITTLKTPKIVLTRSPGGTWTTANVKDRLVDSTHAETQASLFCQLQAKTWLGAPQGSYGLGKPVLTIGIEAEGAKPVVLLIGSPMPDGGHAAIIGGIPTAFEITDGDFGILNASSLALAPAAPATNAPAASAPAAK
jgi:hypothetical protein